MPIIFNSFILRSLYGDESIALWHKMKSVYWVRKDLRLTQNQTLSEFCRHTTEGLFFHFYDSSAKRSGSFRKDYIQCALYEFGKALNNKGQFLYSTELILVQYLSQIYEDFKFESLYFSKEFSPEEIQDEQVVEDWCRSKNIKVFSFYNSTLTKVDNWIDLNLSKTPSFTQFRKAVEDCKINVQPVMTPTQYPLQAKIKIPSLDISSKEIKNVHPSEETALDRLKYYFFDSKKVLNYKKTRNGMIDFDDSTHFSPWLSLGILSPQTIYLELKKFEAQYSSNESTYWILFELLWRDYFKYLSIEMGPRLYNEKGITETNCLPSNPLIHQHFENWCTGKTGHPFIDANMIELLKTGWMSNRGRQNVASFLIHNLKVPWTWGAQYFEKMLIDYDPESNWGNWLYLSGRGTDPRSRVFNIDKQAQDYDPDYKFRNKWLKNN